jgi:DNA polymerase/3'-5' exonuclease PolX
MAESSKQKVLNSLEILRIRDLQSGEKFSALAYTKAIRELKKLDSITSIKDVEGVAGVGKKIKEKVKEILETGSLEAATKAMTELKIDVYQDLLKVHGIGPAKAKDLIEKHKISSVEDLKKHPELLTESQKLGLKYYEDSLERIPRKEMEQHEKKILGFLPEGIKGIIVGSYRRGLESSGDIDVLIKVPEKYSKKESKGLFENIVEKMIDADYMIDILSQGEKKVLGYVRIKDGKVRRIDLLATPEKEYAYAVLYFTGSDTFNVAFRKYALLKGYTLNEYGFKIKPLHGISERNSEHGLKKKKEASKDIPEIKTEMGIFNFLGLQYKNPKDRKDETSVVERKKQLLIGNE